MKSILKFSFLISVILSFSSCLTLHNGVFYNSAQLNTDNFRYVKMNAEGSSTATPTKGKAKRRHPKDKPYKINVL
jgi:hypothetical protein